MKNFFLISLLFSVFASAAQVKGFGFGPYVEAGWPTGNYEQSLKTGIGAGLGADIRLGKAGFTGSIGYMHFAWKSIVTENEIVCGGPLNAVPIRAGFKYRLAPALYIKLESGVAKFTGKSESALIFSPGIGVRILGLDLQAKYEIWKREQSFSFLGLRAGFNF